MAVRGPTSLAAKGNFLFGAVKFSWAVTLLFGEWKTGFLLQIFGIFRDGRI